MSKLYAVCPINVGGMKYKPGQEIKCGDGARVSLLRCGQATTNEPAVSVPVEEVVTGQETDDEFTELSELGLDEQIIEKLQENNLRCVEQLFAYIDAGTKLSKLTGIGEATEAKINESIELYLQSEPEESKN